MSTLSTDEIKLEIKEDSLNVTPQQLSIVDKENNDFIIGFKAENSALKDELKRARNLFDTEKEAFFFVYNRQLLWSDIR